MLENIDFHKHGKVPKINQSGDTILLYNALQEAQQQQGEEKKNIRVEEHDARFDFFINHVTNTWGNIWNQEFKDLNSEF